MYARFVLGGKSLIKAEERLANGNGSVRHCARTESPACRGPGAGRCCASNRAGGLPRRSTCCGSRSVSNPMWRQRYLQLANVELLAKRAEPAAAIDAAISVIREGLVAIPDKDRDS